MVARHASPLDHDGAAGHRRRHDRRRPLRGRSRRSRSRRRAAGAEAANAARDLQNAPSNELTPSALAERARALEGVQVDVWGRADIEAAGMGAFAAVARGSDEEPRLIVLRYAPPGVAGPVLGFV